MKRGALPAALLIVFMAFGAAAIASAEQVSSNLQSMILETFDANQTHHPQYGWYAQGSKYVAKGYPKWTYTEAWPQQLFGTNPQNPNLRVLGVNARFDRRGYNRIEIFPVKEGSNGQLAKDSNGNVIPDPIPIPGQVETLDLWVWGSNHHFTLDVEVEDYTGVMHTLQLGNLDFPGWRDLLVNIPPSIPQSVQTIPKLRGLKLVKFVIWTDPTANVSNFYVYFDQIKVLTDLFEKRIDGENLANPQRVQQIWSGNGVQQGQ